MRQMTITCPLCKGTGKHTIKMLYKKSETVTSVKEMAKLGIPNITIAREVGISRQRVYQILKGGEKDGTR